MEKQNTKLFDNLISIVEQNNENNYTLLCEQEVLNYKKYNDLKKSIVYYKKYQIALNNCKKDNMWKITSSILITTLILLGLILFGLNFFSTLILIIISVLSVSVYFKKLNTHKPVLLDYIPNEYKYLINESFFNISSYYHYIYNDSSKINNKILNKCAEKWLWRNMSFEVMVKKIIEKEDKEFIEFTKETIKVFNINY